MEPEINQILDIILGQWTLAILWILKQQGPIRFNELKRQLGGVTPKVLTARLRSLEQQQIIIRTVKPAKIPEVSYHMSPKGQELIPILDSLEAVSHGWGEEEPCQSVIVQSHELAKTPSPTPSSQFYVDTTSGG